MNTQSNGISGSFESQPITAAVVRTTRPLYWSLRRELWENRFIYIAPLAAAGLFLLAFLISLIHLPARIRSASPLNLEQYREVIGRPYDTVAGLMMLACMLVSVFYCLDALYGERRDRSILFWKSLPVSDATTVLAKVIVPFVIVPLVTTAIGVATQFVMALVSSVVLLASGLSVATLWASLSLPRMSLLLLYHILTAHTYWPAPIYCWMLLVSCSVRRAPFLWAILPPLAVAGAEKLLFHTSYVGDLLLGRFFGSAPTQASGADYIFPTNPMAHITPAEYMSSPGLWIGLLISAGFVLAAVRLRRYREPI